MNLVYLSATLDSLLIVLLVISCITDWRERIIPHWLNIMIAVTAPLGWWAHGLPIWPHDLWHPSVIEQLGLSVIVTAFFLIFQALGAMGGGDVKLLGALALWMPWPALVAILVIMSMAGGVLTLVMAVEHRLRAREGRLEVPYGIAIAVGALVVICKQYLNHFG